jgi:Protein of unknown function (DUF4058)
MVIVQQLRKQLPAGYVAEPRVHLGAMIEVDIATCEHENHPSFTGVLDREGAVATAVWAPSEPSVAVATSLPEQYEYEVRIYDVTTGKHLVATIEIVSPANKDRPEHRSVFVAKCAALLQKGVAVSIVDLVTTRHFNLYLDLLEMIGHEDPTLGEPPPYVYAASCRGVKLEKRTLFQAWSHGLQIGRELPTLPLWLAVNLVIPLNLEESYEQACNDLWIA